MNWDAFGMVWDGLGCFGDGLGCFEDDLGGVLDGLEVARGGAGLEPGEEAEAFRAGLAGQLIFAVAEAADGKGLAAVEMVLPAELHGENHLAFTGEDGVHVVR